MSFLKYKVMPEVGTTLLRVVAMMDIPTIGVNVGDKGGLIEKESNLSHFDNAWVSGDARVYGDARVSGDAQVYGDARVSGDAQVSGNARVYGDAWVSGNARVFGNAQVSGDARVYGDAWVSGDAQVYGDARVSGNAWVSGDAQVYGDARVCFGKLTINIFEDIQTNIRVSLGVLPHVLGYKNNKSLYILYKKVNKVSEGVYTSLHNKKFLYKLGKVRVIKTFDKDPTVSCSSGLHVSTPDYWKKGDTLLQCEVLLKDVIGCTGGKIRCKRLKVLAEIETTSEL